MRSRITRSRSRRNWQEVYKARPATTLPTLPFGFFVLTWHLLVSPQPYSTEKPGSQFERSKASASLSKHLFQASFSRQKRQYARLRSQAELHWRPREGFFSSWSRVLSYSTSVNDKCYPCRLNPSQLSSNNQRWSVHISSIKRSLFSLCPPSILFIGSSRPRFPSHPGPPFTNGTRGIFSSLVA